MTVDISGLLQEKMAGFSKGQRRIAEAILRDYEKTAYMTAANLGKTAGVSESTVVRFAVELGFPGYPEFQHSVQELVRARLTPNQRIDVTSARSGDGDFITHVMQADADRIRYTMEHIDRVAFAHSVKAIAGAKNVYVIGVRSSSSLASFFDFNLSLVRERVCLIRPTSASETLEAIFDIERGDVLIAISFPRYSAKIVNAVRYARSRGAVVIALTDSPLSPIASDATHLLAAQSDMVSFADSLTAPLSVINAVLAAVTAEIQDAAKERLTRLEDIWDEYNVYEKR